MGRASRAAIYSTFLFIDIVGLSGPIISTEAQLKKIVLLNTFIYSAYGEGFGKPKPPSKDYGYETLRILRCIEKLVVIDEQNMIVHYSRTYDVKNMSENLIFGSMHSIQSDTQIIPDKVNLEVYSYDREIREAK